MCLSGCLRVSEVLKGTPVERTPGYVEIGLGSADPEMLVELSGRLQQHDNVWFLRAEMQADFGFDFALHTGYEGSQPPQQEVQVSLGETTCRSISITSKARSGISP